jgi:hypothetical protein
VRSGEKEKTVFPMQFESGVVSKGENSRVGWPDKCLRLSIQAGGCRGEVPGTDGRPAFSLAASTRKS